MTSQTHLAVLLFLTIALPSHLATRAPTTAANLTPDEKDAVDKVSSEMGFSPQQVTDAEDMMFKLRAGAPLTPEEAANVEMEGLPPAVKEKVEQEVDASVKRALAPCNPEEEPVGMVAEDLLHNVRMSPEQIVPGEELSPEAEIALDQVAKDLKFSPKEKQEAADLVVKLQTGAPLSAEEKMKVEGTGLSPEEKLVIRSSVDLALLPVAGGTGKTTTTR